MGRISSAVVLMFTVFILTVGQVRAEGRPLKVGLLLPLTGPVPEWGKKQSVGAEMALEMINRRGGVMGNRVEAVVRDTGGDPQQALAQYRELVLEEGVLAVVGPLFSNTFTAIAPATNDLKTAIIGTASALPGLSDLKQRPYAFRMTVTSDKKEGPSVRAWASAHHIRSVVILYDRTVPVWTTAATKVWPEIMHDLNIEILNRDDPISFETGQKDYGPCVERIKAYHPDGLCISGFSPEVGLLLKEIRMRGLKQPVLVSSGVANPKVIEVAGDAAEDLWSVSLFYLDDPNPKVRGYVARFEKRCREEYPDMNCESEQYDQVVYDILLFLADIMKKEMIGNNPENLQKERETVRDGLANMGVWRGTAGMMAFDEKGDGIRTLHVLKVKDGKWRPAF